MGGGKWGEGEGGRGWRGAVHGGMLQRDIYNNLNQRQVSDVPVAGDMQTTATGATYM